MRAECDADTRKVGERHVWRNASAIRNRLWVNTDCAKAKDEAWDLLSALEAAVTRQPLEPCGWTGDVEDPEAWTCPSCLTEHVAYAVGGE